MGTRAKSVVGAVYEEVYKLVSGTPSWCCGEWALEITIVWSGAFSRTDAASVAWFPARLPSGEVHNCKSSSGMRDKPECGLQLIESEEKDLSAQRI